MNEIELLRELRAGVPARDDAARRRGARRLAAAMQPRPARRARRWALPGLATAAVTAAIAIAAVSGAGLGREPAAGAAQALHDAARQLAQEPAPTLGAGDYWYVESRGQTLSTTGVNGGGSYSALMTTVHREWIAADGSGRITRTDDAPRFVTAADRARWEADGSPDLGHALDESEPAGAMPFPFGSRSLTYAELRALPSDAGALASAIDAAAVRNSWSLSWEKLDLIAELLRNAPVGPALGAALYQVAAGLPDIELVGPTTDPAGRPGVGVAVHSNGLRMELVLDPDTGELLGDRQVQESAGGDLPAGTVLASVSYVRSGVVGSATATP